MNKTKGSVLKLAALLTVLILCLSGCKISTVLPSAEELEAFWGDITLPTQWQPEESGDKSLVDTAAVLREVPEYSGKAFTEINGNKPFFTTADITDEAFENYSSLDIIGRCGTAFACVGKELMPDEERGAIGMIKPSGWHLVKYDFIDGRYLYNRCHLLGFQLTGENANELNLITGTRYMNVNGMLPFENKTAGYIRETDNHVLYRVTPVFEGTNLLASGVLIEAYSVEDNGTGLCFNVFCYNVQPGVYIDYSDGFSSLADEGTGKQIYVINSESMKFHYPECEYAQMMSGGKRREYKGTRTELIEKGYSACGVCNP